ncbi:hypothetical protein HDF13_001318 [Edaphobacter lichenicola]|uniref:Uncharacterized protein n=1 Tax=Tunturiibacter gelidiferens TaxID=3069689 RepID=A0ACC5NWP0_9BACT|nr:hypothetical protein [Edaphobacter lichenicola]
MFVSYNVRDNVRNNNNLPQFQLPVTSFLTSQDLPTHLVRVGYDHIFSPTLLNHALIAFTRVLNKEGFITPSQGKDYSQLVGLPGGTGNYFPGIILNGVTGNESSRVNLGDYVDPNNNGFNSKISDNSYYVSDAISLTKGKHNLTIGGEYRYAVSISSFTNVDSGSFVFSRAQTAGTATTTANSGDGFASFLLGQVAQATVKQNFVTIRNVGQYSALYVQDEFKANKDLNLSLGLRYDVDLPFKELHNFGSQFNPTTINTGAQGTNTPRSFGARRQRRRKGRHQLALLQRLLQKRRATRRHYLVSELARSQERLLRCLQRPQCSDSPMATDLRRSACWLFLHQPDQQ